MSVPTRQAWRDLLRTLTDVAGAQCDECAAGLRHRCLRREVREAVLTFKRRALLHTDHDLELAVARVIGDVYPMEGARYAAARAALEVVERDVLGGLGSLWTTPAAAGSVSIRVDPSVTADDVRAAVDAVKPRADAFADRRRPK